MSVEPSKKRKQTSEVSEQPHQKRKKVAAPSEDKGNNETLDDVTALDLPFDPNCKAEELNFDFDSLAISDQTKKAITDQKFTRMTEIQARAIPILLAGRDVLGAAKTGSGKTMAFLIPTIELLINSNFQMRNGTGALIISPTRELCMQIYDVVQHLTVYHNRLTHGVIMGGTSKTAEGSRLVRGVMLLVATPGRLLDHMQNTKGFKFNGLLALIIDEADRILETGFEEALRAIIRLLPEHRQTMFFSATQTKNVQDIARISVRAPVYIGVDQGQQTAATAKGIDQGFIITEPSHRFLLLYTFLKHTIKQAQNKKQNKKIIVFMSTCNAVKFYAELLNYIDIPVLDLYGQQAQSKRSKTYLEFCNMKTGILLATDVAARGLDIPDVDWVIQYDPPNNTKEYIHRVGRTARGLDATGKALLFLLPTELKFLDYLKESKVPLNEFDFPLDKVDKNGKIQSGLETVVGQNLHLNKSSREAYISYLNGYGQHPMKDVFNVNTLNLDGVAKSFGLMTPPRVSLQISMKSRKNMDNRAAELAQFTGKSQDEINALKKKAQRQWSR